VGNAYAQGQLGSALLSAAIHEDAATRRRAEQRVRAWVSALDGLKSVSIALGSRTPVAGLPAWVTLEVLRGGFATGKPMAGRPLEQDELARAARLSIRTPAARSSPLTSPTMACGNW
jgi:hypothetical protein